MTDVLLIVGFHFLTDVHSLTLAVHNRVLYIVSSVVSLMDLQSSTHP